jgi:hypothetical protein
LIRTRAFPIVVALVLLAPAARAEDSVTVHQLDPRTGADVKQGDSSLAYFTPGALISVVGGYAHATGLGLEGSYLYYPYGKMPSIAYGGFGQLQLYDLKYVRTAIGAQASVGVFGLELGLGFRQGDGIYASTFSTHFGEFLSLGFVTLAVRESVPLIALPTGAASFGFETAFTVKLAVPIAVHGEDPTGVAVRASGRPW